jgi:phage terminase large subunit-like protein
MTTQTNQSLIRGGGLWSPQHTLSDGSLPPTLGPRICRHVRARLVHGEGDAYGEPFALEPWEEAILYRLYEYDPATLKRFVRRVLIVLPKGNGKTELVGAICDAEFTGPVVPTPDGRGGLRKSPNIPIAAASFEQGDRLFGAARTMLIKGPLAPFVEAYDTEVLLRDRPGRMYRVAAEAGTNDGTLPTTFGADEIHEWTGRKERVHLVIGNSLVKREGGLELNISTPDAADPDSLFGRLHAYGMKVATGEVVDPSFLFVWYTAAEHWDLSDPDQLRAAVAEANPASWLDVDRIATRLEVDRIPEHEFRRYHLAQLVRPEGQWLPPGAWEDLADPDRPPSAEGAEVVLFFDGSYNGDSTALVGLELGAVPHLFVVGCWERPDGAAEWLVPREEVKARLAAAMRRWKVRLFGYDPFGWHAEGEEWAEAYGEPPVVLWETNLRKRMAAACSRFYTTVVTGGLSQDGDPRLARHLRNAVVKETPEGAYITKAGRHGPKIDLAVAAVGVLDLAATLEPDYDLLSSVY